VLPDWRVAAFVDGGGAFTERNDDFYQSAGLGLRWLSPIGQIRFDVAVPVHDSKNSGFKLHISMGPPL
jgi:translocation and assembly module TamA